MMTSTIEKKCTFFTREEISKVQVNSVPKHIAIIPDGNRRWAYERDSSTEEGHQQGADIIIDIVKAGKELGVRVLTFYVFSTENWLRPKEEIDAVMWLIETYLIEQKDKMIEEGIKLNVIGNLVKLPISLQEVIENTKKATMHCDKVDLILAINYGGRDDIIRAMKKMFVEYQCNQLTSESITEEQISNYLDTASWSDPELLIRTSGELRVSNFLMWQISYAEIYSENVYWPDFKPHHLYNAVIDYQNRKRRLGH